MKWWTTMFNKIRVIVVCRRYQIKGVVKSNLFLYCEVEVYNIKRSPITIWENPPEITFFFTRPKHFCSAYLSQPIIQLNYVNIQADMKLLIRMWLISQALAPQYKRQPAPCESRNSDGYPTGTDGQGYSKISSESHHLIQDSNQIERKPGDSRMQPMWKISTCVSNLIKKSNTPQRLTLYIWWVIRIMLHHIHQLV